MNRNYLANSITMTRIILSPLLLFTKSYFILFCAIYLCCGLSDLLDGYIARATNTASKRGAVLDSIADAVFIAVCLILFFPLFFYQSWVLIWIGLIFLIRVISLAVGLIKFHALAFLHTYANKATGFAMFCFPFLILLYGQNITFALLCTLASVSALEELIINLCSRNLCRNIKSIFTLNQQKKTAD